MKNSAQAQDEKTPRKKSFLGWWARLTDYCWELFKANLGYLLFALPAYVCIVVFGIFNAWLFLLAGVALLIPAGPALLALYEVTAEVSAGRARNELPRFFAAYRKRWRRGLALSFALIAVGVVVLYPVYFALVTNSAMKMVMMACAMSAVLLLCSILPHLLALMISGERGGLLQKSVACALRGGKASFFAGLLQTVWLFACVAYPYVAVFAILLGMPAVVRMTASYILWEGLDETGQDNGA